MKSSLACRLVDPAIRIGLDASTEAFTDCNCFARSAGGKRLSHAPNGRDRVALLNRIPFVSHPRGGILEPPGIQNQAGAGITDLNDWGLHRQPVQTLPNANVCILADSEALCIPFLGPGSRLTEGRNT